MALARGALVLLLALAAAPVRAVQVHVPAHAAECFGEHVDGGNKITGSFEVISSDSGIHDVDAAILGPAGEAHYHVTRQRQGHFTVMAPATGLYRLCFSNRKSTMTGKTVAFSLRAGDDLYRDIAKQEHISPLETEITKLQDAIALVEDEQEYMWARERASKESELACRGGGGCVATRAALRPRRTVAAPGAASARPPRPPSPAHPGARPHHRPVRSEREHQQARAVVRRRRGGGAGAHVCVAAGAPARVFREEESVVRLAL
jgi:hypothetical protein